MQIELSSFKDRNINFLSSFLFYIIGLAFLFKFPIAFYEKFNSQKHPYTSC